MDKQVNPENLEVAIGSLKQFFGDQFQTSKSLREQHSHTTTYLPSQLPDGVLFAKSTEDVQEAVKICGKYKVPIIPFGTGTSLEGGVNAPSGGISIDLMQMNKVISVNRDDLDCVVQPGVTREGLNDYLRDTGLFFPIDPGANASLGGMAATRASGTNAVRYGTMRENVVNVTAVMPDGEIIKTSSRAKKSSAGYDLTRLLVGSEGTLGIITELTLKLYGVPEKISSAICQFESVEDACQVTSSAIQYGIPMARIELLCELQIEMLNAYSGYAYPLKPTLMLEFHGSEDGVKEQVEFFKAIAGELGGNFVDWAEKTEDRNRLWKARHDAYYAQLAFRPGAKSVATDACVPISRLAQAVRETQEDVKRLGLIAPVVGHVGDGNFHISPLIMLDDEEEIAKMHEMIELLTKRAIDMEGTCTGEHGIGQGKKKYLRLEHGAGVDVMSAIKSSLDPDNIMNPGKVVDFHG